MKKIIQITLFVLIVLLIGVSPADLAAAEEFSHQTILKVDTPLENPNCSADFFMDVQPFSGNSSLPHPVLDTSCDGTSLFISTNTIPNHETGSFPNNRNPNKISAQDDHYSLNLAPTIADRVTILEIPNPFGIAINGILFDPIAAEWYNRDRNSGWNFNGLTNDLGFDMNNAHVQPTGDYHYHGIPEKLVELVLQGEAMSLIGYAADGFPVYLSYGYNDPNDPDSAIILVRPSYQIKEGTRPSGPGGVYDGTYVEDYEYVEGLGDLDICNGRFGVTPEYPAGIYHYYLTDDFPNIPRCLVGTPDTSFIMNPGGPQGEQPDGQSESQDSSTESSTQGQGSATSTGQGGPPQEAINACNGLSVGAACSFTTPRGTVNGSCSTIQNQMACKP